MTELPGKWDFYICRVDDAPASIHLDLAWIGEPAKPGATRLHVAFFQMEELGPHGMGMWSEMERWGPVEDALFARAHAQGAVPVGRLRNKGVWQLCVYGPPDLPWSSWVAEAAPGAEVAFKDDPDWSYYRDFLLPDAERWRWIMDRRVVDQLRAHGDDENLPRPIDHFIDFEGEVPDAFTAEVGALGFAVHPTQGGVKLVREDTVELGRIHAEVMDLIQRAAQHGGEYDGWGCPIAQAEG